MAAENINTTTIPASTNDATAKNSIILNQTHGWWATISDWISNLLFGGNPKYSVIIKNKLLSEKLTALFNNTNVDVYVYDSKQVNCFTMIGRATTATPLVDRLGNSNEELKSTVDMVGKFERFLQVIQSELSAGGKITTFKYDPYTKKFNLNVQNVVVYVSTALINILDNDDEIVAILLSEVGQNLQVTIDIIKTILSNIGKGSATVTGISAVSYLLFKYLAVGDINVTGVNQVDNFLIKALLSLTFFSMFCIFLSMYLSRRQQRYSDYFAAKVGYGEHFSKAINKVHNYLFTSSFSTMQVYGLNIFDRVLHFINKALTYIGDITAKIGLNSRLSTGDRSVLAKQNELEFNNS